MWWGVIGEQRGPTPAHVPFMVSIVPAIVLVLVATLSRESSDRRMWFGPAVAVTAMMWLLQVVAWILLYADLTAIEVPAGGSWLMLAGLALTIAGGLGYARSCHRRQPIEVASRLRGTPATWALVGAGGRARACAAGAAHGQGPKTVVRPRRRRRCRDVDRVGDRLVGIYEDHVDSVTIDAGSLLMVVGLFFAAAAALSDAADELP